VSKSAPAASSSRSVRQYYEQNTRLFLSHGRQSSTRTIHRAVWAPGVSDHQGALNYTNQLIFTHLLELAEDNPGKTIRAADLGCGVGGSLFYLSSRMPASFWGLGLTISPSQAKLARRHADKLNLQQRCAFIEADFQRLPLAGGLEAAFSIEAFAHAPDPKGFLREASRLLGSQGRLMLCDDFQTGQGEEDNFWLQAFRSGWRVPGLRSAEQVEEMARGSGLVLKKELDLTPYLRLSAVPSWMARRIVGAGARLKHLYWQSISGGTALQQCLKRGLLSYRFLVFDNIG
jgi:tocopherol O-methyltransferase